MMKNWLAQKGTIGPGNGYTVGDSSIGTAGAYGKMFKRRGNFARGSASGGGRRVLRVIETSRGLGNLKGLRLNQRGAGPAPDPIAGVRKGVYSTVTDLAKFRG